jgi:hypothetical protein
MLSQPSATVTAMLPNATARPASQAIIVRFRSHRSMNAPAGRYSSRNGSVCANPTTPALAGECVTASTSSGNAIEVTRVPTVDTTWLLHSTMKSRLRRSGTGHAAAPDRSSRTSSAPGLRCCRGITPNSAVRAPVG